ncbi:MAG: 2-amino-4-hydroxy-6-hydroxymethyldihydropteridine diphosphokinase [Anaerolineales bacterium]|nr:2-amino-4-hydroxy-6-hydroxymethyldihydropteridine diphosphokinase [Anaerolineales bacterium]
MAHVYLALGTNLGDRPANLQAALAATPPLVRVLHASPMYETPPWGLTEQPAFLNMVVEARTDLEPLALLSFLKQLESDLGRIPSVRYGPRLIDLDILFYDDLVLDGPALTIPHPRLHERAFVLVPLADLAPDRVHPRFGRTVRALLREVDTAGIRPWSQSPA